MTTITGPSPQPVFSTRTPYLPFVVLIGAVAVIAVVFRLLNSPAPAPSYPLSGAPIEADGPPPPPITRAASGSLSVLMPAGVDGVPLDLGPAAFPPEASVILSATLPTTERTTVTIRLARLGSDGTLTQAQPVALSVVPDRQGAARVSTTVSALTEELGPGIYRVGMTWEGDQIGGMDVGLGLLEPSGVAIFDEPRLVEFAAGAFTGRQFDAAGRVSGEKPYTLGRPSGAPAVAYARYDGVPHLLISEGVWAGFWVPMTEGVTLN